MALAWTKPITRVDGQTWELLDAEGEVIGWVESWHKCNTSTLTSYTAHRWAAGSTVEFTVRGRDCARSVLAAAKAWAETGEVPDKCFPSGLGLCWKRIS